MEGGPQGITYPSMKQEIQLLIIIQSTQHFFFCFLLVCWCAPNFLKGCNQLILECRDKQILLLGQHQILIMVQKNLKFYIWNYYWWL